MSCHFTSASVLLFLSCFLIFDNVSSTEWSKYKNHWASEFNDYSPEQKLQLAEMGALSVEHSIASFLYHFETSAIYLKKKLKEDKTRVLLSAELRDTLKPLLNLIAKFEINLVNETNLIANVFNKVLRGLRALTKRKGPKQTFSPGKLPFF